MRGWTFLFVLIILHALQLEYGSTQIPLSLQVTS